ncbi:MAG: flagellar biosynthesis protein FlgA, partial [Actinomycetales bacterium]
MRTSLPRLVLEHRRTLAAVLAGIAVLAGLSSVRESTDGPLVVAAARDLPSGRSLTAADVRIVRLTDGSVPHAALTSESQAVGRRLAGAVRGGELLTDRRVLGPGPL